MKFRYASLQLSDETEIDLPQAGVVIFVGPNNAGKSQSLRDLIGMARDHANYNGKTVKSAKLRKEGSKEDAKDWARENLPQANRAGITTFLAPGWGEVTLEDFSNQWIYPEDLGILSETLLLHADGATRLTAGNAQQNLDFRSTLPTHPIQRAYREPKLERELDLLSKSAFDLGVTVDRYAGGMIPLRVGTRPDFEHTDGVPTEDFLSKLGAMPTLEEQGDGVKSFLGLLLQLTAGSQQVILVDEPEAFLHPPQARLLGKLLAQRAVNQQVFIATHSSAILQGSLESGVPITIVRLTREQDVNHAAVLSDAALKELWSDPLLRYSDVLEGLFYDAVVLCESDSDCRYYAAVRDVLYPEEGGDRRPELLWVHCGGKNRLPVVIRALKAVGVPVIVVSDFDLLRVAADIEKVVDAQGGKWSSFSANQAVLARALESESKPLRKTPTMDALNNAFETKGEVLSSRDVEEIRSILKAETGWDRAKRAGLGGVPQGDPSEAASTLIADLISEDILLVPVGELERFVPTMGGHGPTWVNSVLSARLHESPGREARDFMECIEQRAILASGDSI